MAEIFKIDANSRSVSQLLGKIKYSIDYYQREYRWQTKHIEELINDLTDKFLGEYAESHSRDAGEKYAHYFLGPIILSKKNGQTFVVDGQQRLTSLTLFLIYLNNLQILQERSDTVTLEDYIFSETRGQKSFNLQVPERTEAIEALYNQQIFDASTKPESVQNIMARYEDIDQLFPDELKERALPFFIDWLLYNVDLVEIIAYSDEEAYTVFETMNDRGLSLNPTDMLKGYLLSKIQDEEAKEYVNRIWKNRVLELVELGKRFELKNEEIEACKAWLRSKYADSIRERKRGANNQAFEQIGTAFHRWIRENTDKLGLVQSNQFRDFITQNFEKYTRHYAQMRELSHEFDPNFAYIYFNAYCNFTLQYILALAPIRLTDDEDTVIRKVRLVTGFVDIFIARRMVNFRTLSYSAIVYTMFNIMVEIRDLSVHELAKVLRQKVDEMPETFAAMDNFYMHQQNKWHIHYLLARISYHIEKESGIASNFTHYINRSKEKGAKPFEIEHIWADKYVRHVTDFGSEVEFRKARNSIGGLILLPRGSNQSYNDSTYEDKLPHYLKENLLVQSLHSQTYQKNPNFLSYIRASGLAFQAYEHFGIAEQTARQELYRQVCEQIWNPARFEEELR